MQGRADESIRGTYQDHPPAPHRSAAARIDGAELDDEALFGCDVAEDEEDEAGTTGPPAAVSWVVLVVDDDQAVHDVTSLVLRGLEHEGRPLRLLHARTAVEAQAHLLAQPEIALMLLDVVMETPDAGLRLVRSAREGLASPSLRILLRTGQPGHAPELDVVRKYEIDGYEFKGTLTAQGLTSRVIAALRCCALLRRIERNRAGSEALLRLTAGLAAETEAARFAQATLLGLGTVLGAESSARFLAPAPVHLGPRFGAPWVELAALGVDGRPAYEAQAVAAALRAGEAPPVGLLLPLSAGASPAAAIWLAAPPDPSLVDSQLVELMQRKIGALFAKLETADRLVRTHQAMVFALADLGEFRDTDTGAHVKRVAHTSACIASQLAATGAFPDELDAELVATVGMASALHDIGKVSISDAILRKPGLLDAEERRAMEAHAAVGGRILGRAAAHVGEPSVLSVAEEIAGGHHEWFDGRGYPKGLRGHQIPLSARITAVADVFDALTHARPYKEPWPEEQALAYIRDLRGAQFDPDVVDAFLTVVEQPSWRTGLEALGA